MMPAWTHTYTFFIRSVRDGYCAVVTKLQKKFPFGNPILKSVQILNPENRLKITEATGNIEN